MINLLFAAINDLLNADQNFATIPNNCIKPPMFADRFSKKPGSVNYQIYIKMHPPPCWTDGIF